MFFSMLLFFSANAAFANECDISSYVISGSIESNSRGARTWDLVKLRREASTASAGDCVKNTFDRAVNESKDYWNYIAEKYNCGESPNENCPESRWQNVNKNLAYVDSMSNRAITARMDDDCAVPSPEGISETTRLNLLAIEDAVAEVATSGQVDNEGLCSHVDEKMRAGTGKGDDIASMIGGCVVGALKGFFKDGVWNFVTEIWDMLSSPLQTLSALKTLVAELATNFKETSYQLGTSILNHFKDRYAADFKDWKCLNDKARSAAICDAVGTAGFDVLAIVLGAKAFKAGAVLIGKGAVRVADGARDLSRTIRDSRAAAVMDARTRRLSRDINEIPAAEIAKIEADFNKFSSQITYDGTKGTYIKVSDYWTQWSGATPEAKQGFKFHVSARPENMQEIAEAILPELERRGLSHKFANNVKRYTETAGSESTQAGKFIAIYSENIDEAREIKRLVNEVMERKNLKHNDFVDVPGERNVGPGLYVRYGAYYDDYLVTPDGRQVPDIRGAADPDWAPEL